MKINYLITIILMLAGVIDTCHAQNGNKDFDDRLKAMNNVSELPYIEASNNKRGKAFNILVLGNSLSYHDIAPDIGWHYAAGMAASEINKDYAHLLLRMTDSIMPEKRIVMRITNIAQFERNLTGFDVSSLDHIVSFQPDVIIIQIGENVSFNEIHTPEVFRDKYIALVRYLKKNRHPTVICTTSFYTSATKNYATQQVASATKSFLVDLSHLVLSDARNYATNEENYPGDKSVWKIDGVGAHPGDFGMKNIAQQIFTVINVLYGSKSNKT